MRALVTGAAGFVGSHLVDALVAQGDTVVGVDCFTPYYDIAQKQANAAAIAGPAFELVDADLRVADLEPLLDGIDVVFHQAAQPGVRLSWSSGFREYVEHNVIVTQRLLDALPAAGSRRFVFASSSSVYGQQRRYPDQRRRRARALQPLRRDEARGGAALRRSTPRTSGSTPSRCGTSPCSARGSVPTCRSTGCARPR